MHCALSFVSGPDQKLLQWSEHPGLDASAVDLYQVCLTERGKRFDDPPRDGLVCTDRHQYQCRGDSCGLRDKSALGRLSLDPRPHRPWCLELVAFLSVFLEIEFPVDATV